MNDPRHATAVLDQLAAVSPPFVRPVPIYLTAFIEGLIVIVVEIAGARALAPFYGTSLQVWTAQITMTLFFLAVGYGVGGLLAKRIGPWTLPTLFATAGGWLILYSILRTPVLASSSKLGVALGSLTGASVLFGLPLLMLGAVSPVLVAIIDSRRPGAGSAAGRLFFTNTMGGLAGGWLTAFLLIPYSSLRLALLSTGLVLLALALLWAIFGRALRTAAIVATLLVLGLGIRVFHQPARDFKNAYGETLKVQYSRQSPIGLLQVIDLPTSRMQLTNGVIQGDMNLATGRTMHDYIDNLHALAYMHHPEAKTAVILGLGPGLLAKELSLRGLDVTAVELEPRVVELARRYFDLPASVRVVTEDARTFLRNDDRTYDLVFLDTYAGESTAWYLLTVEALREMKSRLNPGGKLLINNAAFTRKPSLGLSRIESTALAVFNQCTVYLEKPTTEEHNDIGNATLVAGDSLAPRPILPPTMTATPDLAHTLTALARPASPDAPVTTDDRSDLDYIEAPLRVRWRTMIWDWMNASLLWD